MLSLQRAADRRLVVVWLACAAAGLAEAQNRPEFTLPGHSGSVSQLAFHPDGTKLASIANDEVVIIWDLARHAVDKRLAPAGRTVDGRSANLQAGTRRRLEAICFTPEGVLASASEEPDISGTLRVWDIAAGTVTREVTRGASSLRAAAFSPDGKLLAAAMRDGERADHVIGIYDVSKWEKVKELRGDRLSATRLAWCPDGKTLVSAGGTVIHTWDVDQGTTLKRMTTHRKAILDLKVSPDGEQFATCDSDDTLRLWNTREGRLQREIKHEQKGVLALAYSPDGEQLASGGANNSITLWNPKSGRKLNTLWHHAGEVSALAYSRDGKWLASGSKDQTIALWQKK